MGYRNILFLGFVPLYWLVLLIYASAIRRKRFTALFRGLGILAIVLLDTAFYFLNTNDGLFPLASVVLTFTLLYLESGRLVKSFLLSVVWSVVGMLSELIGAYTIVVCFGSSMDDVAHEDIAYSCAMFISRLILFAFAVVYSGHAIRNSSSQKTYLYWVVTAFTFVGSIIVVLVFYFYSYTSMQGKGSYRMLVVVLIMLCINLMMFFLYERQEQYYEIKNRLNYMEYYVNVQKENYEAERKTIEREKIEQHDMKNYMLLLEHYVKENDWESLRKAIMQKQMEKHYPDSVSTGNEYLDVILTSKFRVAMENGIAVKKNILLQESLETVHPSDLIAIVGNALDNAIEATQRIPNGWIDLHITAEKGLLRMKISNPTAKAITFDETGNVASDKMEQGHGYGIPSMRMIAEKYSGNIKIQCGNGLFEIDILLFV